MSCEGEDMAGLSHSLLPESCHEFSLQLHHECCEDSPSVQESRFEDSVLSSFDTLTSHLEEVEDILDHLMAVEVITANEKEDILSESKAKRRKRRLLDCLIRKGEVSCRELCLALRYTGQADVCPLPSHLEQELNQYPEKINVLSLDKWKARLVALYEDVINNRNEEERKQFKNAVRISDHEPVVINYGCEKPDVQVRHGYHKFTTEEKNRRQVNWDQIFDVDEDTDHDVRPHTVLMLGGPGMGKTSICYKLLGSFMQQNCQRTHEFVFFFSLREYNNLPKELCLRDLLFDYSGVNMNGLNKKRLMKQLVKRQDKLLIMLDGYDEGDTFMNTRTSINRERVKAKRKVLFRNIVTGDLLPRAQVLLTSRPYGLVHRAAGVARVTELAGLSRESVSTILTKSLDQAAWNDMKIFLNTNPDIASLLCIPVNVQKLASFCAYLYDTEQNLLDHIPITKSSLYTMQMLPILRQCARIEDAECTHHKLISIVLKLVALAELAIESPSDLNNDFTDADLDKCKLSKVDIVSCGLVSSYNHVSNFFHHSITTVYFFNHLTNLEWFCAIYIVRTQEERLRSLIEINDGKYDVILTFAVGLLGNEKGQEILHSVSRLQKADCQKKAIMILENIIKSNRCKMGNGNQFMLDVFFEGHFQDPRPVLSRLASDGKVMKIEGITLHTKLAVRYFISCVVKCCVSPRDSSTDAIIIDTVKLVFDNQGADEDVLLGIVSETCRIHQLQHLWIKGSWGDKEVDLSKSISGKCLELLLVERIELGDACAARLFGAAQARILCVKSCNADSLQCTMSKDVSELYLCNNDLHDETLRSMVRRQRTPRTGIAGQRYDGHEDAVNEVLQSEDLNVLGLWLNENEGRRNQLGRAISSSSVKCVVLNIYGAGSDSEQLLTDVLRQESDIEELWLSFSETTPPESLLRSLGRLVAFHKTLVTVALMDHKLCITPFLQSLFTSCGATTPPLKRVYTKHNELQACDARLVRKLSKRLRCPEMFVTCRGSYVEFYAPIVFSKHMLSGIPDHVKKFIETEEVLTSPISISRQAGDNCSIS